MNRINRKSFVVVALFGLMLTAGIVIAAGQQSTPTYSRAYLHSYNLDSTGLALEGYCPVTYHTHNVARQGSAEFASTYNGVDYHFVSAAAKRMFESNPEKYIPAYGGWCACRKGKKQNILSLRLYMRRDPLKTAATACWQNNRRRRYNLCNSTV